MTVSMFPGSYDCVENGTCWGKAIDGPLQDAKIGTHHATLRWLPLCPL